MQTLTFAKPTNFGVTDGVTMFTFDLVKEYLELSVV
jgi:hypothetical protein